MRSDIIRTYKIVHTWVGIVSGLFLFVAFYAGALTVFEPALARWATPPAAEGITPLDQAEALIGRILAAHPEAARDFTLHLGEEGDIPARLTWKKSRMDTEMTAAEMTADGGLRVERLTSQGLGQFIDDLHRTAGLPTDVELGAAIMGVVSALYLLAMVSGVIIILPSLLRDLFALRIGPNLKRMWMDVHNLLGLFSLPFHVIIALTAVVFGLHDEIYGVLDRVVFEGGLRRAIQAESPFAAIPPDPAPAAMLPPAELLKRVERIAPDFRPDAVQYINAGTRGAAAAIWGRDERYFTWGRGLAVLSATTGDVVRGDYLPGRQGAYSTVVASLFALHFASFGGPAVKWTYLALGLAGAFLFYSGNLLWIESRRRRGRETDDAPPGRSVRWMGALTVGIGLGCVAGASAAIAFGKLSHGMAGNPDQRLWGIYYAVLVGAAAWAFLRGAGRAGRELTWIAAACTALIPLASLAGWAVPSLGLWTWSETLGVDAVALCAAAALAVAAARRRRRDAAPSSP